MRPPKRTADGLLRVIRERGWTITQAGDRLGVHYTTLIGIRDGHHGPGLQTMEAVETALPEYNRDFLFPREAPEGNGHEEAV